MFKNTEISFIYISVSCTYATSPVYLMNMSNVLFTTASKKSRWNFILKCAIIELLRRHDGTVFLKIEKSKISIFFVFPRHEVPS